MNANIVLSKFARGYMELKKKLPIRPSEMAVLNIITQCDGQYTPLRIAEMLSVSKPMIAAHIQVLLKKGYIRKEPSPEDRRSFYVLPTAEALKLTEIFRIRQAEYLKAMEASLGETDFAELLRMLQTLQPVLDTLQGGIHHAK